MRVYLSPTIQQLVSTLLLMASLGIVGFILWKTVDTWQADPNLKNLQEMIRQDQS